MTTNNEDNQGGFLLPEFSYVDVAKDDLLSTFIRHIGQGFITFGAWLRSFGYTRKKIYPRQSLLDVIKELKTK